MNRGGALQTSPVQQMMAGNPNEWWNIRPPNSQQPASPSFLPASSFSNFLTPSSSLSSWHDINQDLPESWSQLLMSGVVVSEEDKLAGNKLGSCWEEQMVSEAASHPLVDVKQETYHVYGHGSQLFHPAKPSTPWSQIPPPSSPKSCLTTTSILDFSNNNTDARPPPDPSSECNSNNNSTAAGGAFKKARVQPSPTQSSFKVRKEKLGDRITALHQLVSPFGKTDTASVLLEAIGYIRFLQSQIEALSLPYLDSGAGNTRNQQPLRNNVQGEKNCIFPEDPGQLLNENCLKRKVASEQDCEESEAKKDLRSRGLCLVPVSCTLQVGSDNGADYWAPAFGGVFR